MWKKKWILFFEYLTSKDEAENDMSLLIQKALENIREYYDQGITLGDCRKSYM